MMINLSAASFNAASLITAGADPAPAATASNNTGAASNAPAANSSASPASALSLFAQVMTQSTASAPAAVATADTGTGAPPPKAINDDHKDDVPADIAAATAAVAPADGSLPAMAAPVMALPLPLPLPASASAPAPAETSAPAQAQAQINLAQSNPGLVLSMHPAAVMLGSGAAPASRDTREPLAAASPVADGDASDTAFKLTPASMPAIALRAAPAEVAAATAAAAPAARTGVTVRDGERTTEPVAAGTPSLNLGPGAATGQGADTIKLNGPAQQWQAPLREALGDRLQTQVERNGETAVIRLDPPMLGRIDISIRHMAGSLQVNVSASNTEVLRQLQNIGDNLRSDLAQRQYTDVSVNISATPRSPAAPAFAEGDARGQRQPGRQQDDNEPGSALSDDAASSATFAMYEREQH
ncbi:MULTISPECIES: flagellar hook-length control protein FliK [unclassified Janthinobacterium]|uniref:flagellar hook-length control protein FliK n=1 Tax=unclassified Janthinobacterium TaxID=2610881 RepID=UPI0016196C5F|nr:MULTISPECIES: flagellar hook-length control protein FliK [unclassified Janthinobacterium]MBB5366635.1 flagellar hook-length control protein FliK [Janthinobacterium sp. K2C7]MBB5380887.1 flagellar hook-length control protein FliK [Janthinobacterium sp. K2Li3]MBB5385017.1 flagellar hook-length control protein FliK [Janthinobacterium sp. K2E3]